MTKVLKSEPHLPALHKHGHRGFAYKASQFGAIAGQIIQHVNDVDRGPFVFRIGHGPLATGASRLHVER